MAERLALCDRARPQPNWPLIAPHLVDLELAVVLDRAGDRDGASRVMAMGLELGAAQVSQGPPHPASLVNYAAWLDADGHRLWPTDPRLAADRFRRAVSALEQAASSPSGSGAEPALAAVLAFCPDPSVRDPHRAVELAHRGAKGPIRRSYVAGAALYEAGQLTDARAELEAYLDEDRSEGAHGQIARAYLAMAFWRAGETGRAAAELRKAGESFRSDPRTLWQASTAIRRAEMLLSDRRAGSK
jgi:tetratricopeptide (TPR) repeat protein